MITKMKKVLLFIAETESGIDPNLTLLGKLGVLHITPFQVPKHYTIDRVDARIKQLVKALTILKRFSGRKSDIEVEVEDYANMERGEIHFMEKVLDIEHRRDLLKRRQKEQRHAKWWYEHWGNVDINDLEALQERGIYVRLYLLSDRELKSVENNEKVHLLGKIEQENKVALITEDSEEKLGFQEIVIPRIQCKKLAALMEKTDGELAQQEAILLQLRKRRYILKNALDERNRRLKVRNIQYGGIAIEQVVGCWKGYMPEHKVENFINEAEKNSWGYIIEDPSEEEIDEVPTLIQAPRWAERIRPIMNFMGLTPGYRELDVSKVFMIFFTFFTGILVGDAGYGFTFLLITFLAHRKMKFARKIEFELMYTLTSSIMVWGVLTGTYFGSEAIANIPLLSSLKVSKLASFGGDEIFIQKVMFITGAIHLTVGHLQQAWKNRKSLKSLSELGWVSVVWGLYLIVNQMVLSIPAPAIMTWLFIVGASLISLFNNPNGNFIKGVLSSLGNLPLSIINGFSDVISYIRLYAVGLATVLMAATFNEMAIGSGISTVLSAVVAVIILILGHGLNMILAAMSVIVHGVRLNMLEYGGHANVEFSGNEYEPFKLKNKTK